MTFGKFEEEYRLLMEQIIDSEEFGVEAGEVQRRKHPRFKTQSGTGFAYINSQYNLIDISASGLAFVSNQRHRMGERIKMDFENFMEIEAEVVSCSQIEPEPDSIEDIFRVHCKFSEENQGMKILMMLNEKDFLVLPNPSA